MQSAGARGFAPRWRSTPPRRSERRSPRTFGDPTMIMALVLAFVTLSCGLARAQDYFRCDQEQSIQEVRRLTAAKVIISVDVFMPNVTVVVDDRSWQRSDLAYKRNVAQNVDCATGGPNNHMLHTISFRSNR